MQNIAVIGIGRWGKNLIREFSKISNVLVCCSLGDSENKIWLQSNYPKIKYTNNIDEIVNNKIIDSVVIATPIVTHYSLAKKMLLAGKNVFLEKPMATKTAEASDLLKSSLLIRKKLLIGHVFLYHEIFSEIKKIITNKKILKVIFEWNKYGSFSEDVKWNLLSHEIALVINLIGIPIKVSAINQQSIKSPADIGKWELKFKSDTECYIYINRVSESKSKKVTLYLEDQKLIWEDSQLYSEQEGSQKLIYKTKQDALSYECKDFIECIEGDLTPFSDGKLGFEVVKLICSIQN